MMTVPKGSSWAIGAKEVIGVRVIDPAGGTLGEITDIVLDVESDRILFVVTGAAASSADWLITQGAMHSRDSTADYYEALRYAEAP
jgi:sporulation protein YlmC with PRC-barrel domain